MLLEEENSRLFLYPRDLSHIHLLAGGGEERVRSRIRSLFHLCGKAQEILAQKALSAARGEAVPETPSHEEEILREALLETLRALLLPITGLPPLYGPNSHLWGKIRALGETNCPDFALFLERFREIVERFVLGESAPRFLSRKTEQDWDQWATGGEASPVARIASDFAGDLGERASVLPPLIAEDGLLLEYFCEMMGEEMGRKMEGPLFLEAPHVKGEGREPGPLARMRDQPLVFALLGAGRPLSARLAARLSELALSVGENFPQKALSRRVRSLTPERGVGVSFAETARGLLVHRCRMEGDQVTDYRILAPTEWIFHPEKGPFRRWFDEFSKRAPSPESLHQGVREALWIFDPCAPVWEAPKGGNKGDGRPDA